MEDMLDINRMLETQGNMHNKVEVQANLESRSPTQSPGPSCLQINV
jgi:hypothetical protein